ncbi:MAG: stage II sporulation protein P [Vallitalea sp.]|jgi:stage II sporulation protein P|nr:stage II sporulation protein P [Vallitalea sp.]
MNKSYLINNRNKKISIIYLLILIVLTIFILIKLLGLYFFNEVINFKNIVYDDINSSFFSRIINSMNPSVEYYLKNNTKSNSEISNNNKIEVLYGYNIPLISFMLNIRDYTYSTVSENFPRINIKDNKIKNELEHYEHDESFFATHTLEEQTPVINVKNYTLEQLNNFGFLQSNLYTIDKSINLTKQNFPMDKFLSKDMSINMNDKGPKVLIYHTHSQESFVDSVKGNKEHTVVGLGDELERILEEKYNIEVLHHRKEYDIINGKIDRNEAYQRIEAPLKSIIKENPSIEVLMDIHRDGIKGNFKLLNEIDGKSTAKIMFFNGLALYKVMPNKYVTDNMAFSLQMQLKANELYPNFTRKIYLRGYRYNLHLKPKSLLIEVGAQTNTVEEAMNAMEPLARILYEVIK